MSEATINWDEELKKDEIYILAQKSGISTDDLKASSEEEFKSLLEELKKQLKELPKDRIDALAPEDAQKLQEWLAKENTENPASGSNGENHENQDNEGSERQTLEVGKDDREGEANNLDWIEEKRKFWKEFAEENENNFQNDPQKDTESKTFSCTLNKDKDAGIITYTSPTAARITQDSHLTMYQGLVKDAMQNNLSITFGLSLDEKQKAMLLAACLMEQGTYANGEKLQMVNPPKIDMNAEYIKSLPENVQKVLGDYAQEQARKAKQEEIDNKLNDVRTKLRKNQEAAAKLGKDDDRSALAQERENLRLEQLAALKEKVKENPSAHTDDKNKDKENIEKIMAARMGIINDPNIKDVNGKPIAKNDKFTARKNEQNPGLKAYLENKYGPKEK